MPKLGEIKEVILDFESNQKVQSWSYEGMDLWPILRSLVYVECRNEITSAENGVLLDWKKNRGKKGVRSLLRKLKTYFIKHKTIESPYLAKNEIKACKKDALFFGSWYFRTKYEGRFVNRFFYPIISFLAKEYDVQTLEVEYSTHARFREEYRNLKGIIDFVEDYPKQIENSERIEKLMNSEMFQSFFSQIEEKGVSEKLKFLIANKVEKVYSDSLVYQFIFQKYKPKYAFCLTFFNESMFAMIYAASKEGVKTIDVGHGFPSDKENMIYSKLTNIPDRGFNTMPDIFWVWDKPVQIALEQWTNKQNKHQVLVGGNPWLEFSHSSITKKPLSDKKVILYTLTVSLPEDFVLDAMKKTEGQFEWWIRLHPSIRASQNMLEEIFLRNNVNNFNLVEANELELSFILKNVDVHISRNSSSIYESIVFGNYPVILDREGIEYFEFYIKSGQAIGLEKKSPEMLIQLLETANKQKINSEILEIKYKSALNFLFKSRKAKNPYSIV